jgi:hypothetical protein
MGNAEYLPALGYSGLTPPYDIVLRNAARQRIAQVFWAPPGMKLRLSLLNLSLVKILYPKQVANYPSPRPINPRR